MRNSNNEQHMKIYQQLTAYSFATTFLFTSLFGAIENDEKNLPDDMQKIMLQSKYEHAIWGLYVKDLQTEEILYDLHSNKLFSPASTTKLFTIAALLNAFGNDYRFKTPVFATAKITDGKLQGNLIMVGQGDLTMGGRQPNSDTIAFTKMDHTISNEAPGVILTSQDPLQGINDLAKQTFQKGLRELSGDVIIDDSLFETVEKRGMILSPMIINENLIDLVINPTEIGEIAKLSWRPQVPGYKVDNQVKTVAKDGALELEISSDESGHNIVVKGTVPLGQKDIIRNSAIKDPNHFARTAFIQALQKAGVKVNVPSEAATMTKPLSSYKDLDRVALWTSPPLSEYAKLILKVSHNLGANLSALLLASHDGKKTFDEGIQLIGKFTMDNVKLSPNEFVMIDGAGGSENRFSPKAEVQLLEY
ncbi:MAG: D-alanyl-D-alanine carboxypeptidase/D-alanyl-D-alanine-endopeptidase, partial [Parachlamydiaceae bacterium]|nr:D-alanyl-D-alanine carboxypeptidase/D-alanyl-D-alanine-endopeptidase [Parachlamydiaceae bacterium]